MKDVPNVNQIFEDLDDFRDFCRFEGKVYDERFLYNNSSEVWREYKRYCGEGGRYNR